MVRRTLTIGVIAIALIWTSSAFADQMTITKTANPIESSYPGVSLDVLGVMPGMSVDAVKKVLIANYHSQPTSEFAQTSVTYKSVNMASQLYVTSMLVSPEHGNWMTVYFGTPATGNTVVEVYRGVSFPNAKIAPTVAAVRAALDKKYGPETKVFTERGFMKITWAFGKSGHTSSCSTNGSRCQFSQGFNPKSCGIYSVELASGDYVVIRAALNMPIQDLSRVSALTVTLHDEADKAVSCNAASKQIHTAAVAAYKKESTPGAVPKL